MTIVETRKLMEVSSEKRRIVGIDDPDLEPLTGLVRPVNAPAGPASAGHDEKRKLNGCRNSATDSHAVFRYPRCLVHVRVSAPEKGQAPFAGTALRVLRTKGACPPFSLRLTFSIFSTEATGAAPDISRIESFWSRNRRHLAPGPVWDLQPRLIVCFQGNRELAPGLVGASPPPQNLSRETLA